MCFWPKTQQTAKHQIFSHLGVTHSKCHSFLLLSVLGCVWHIACVYVAKTAVIEFQGILEYFGHCLQIYENSRTTNLKRFQNQLLDILAVILIHFEKKSAAGMARKILTKISWIFLYSPLVIIFLVWSPRFPLFQHCLAKSLWTQTFQSIVTPQKSMKRWKNDILMHIRLE